MVLRTCRAGLQHQRMTIRADAITVTDDYLRMARRLAAPGDVRAAITAAVTEWESAKTAAAAQPATPDAAAAILTAARSAVSAVNAAVSRLLDG